MKLIIGMSGASGVVYGVRLLEVLKEKNVETHLIITDAAEEILRIESDKSVGHVRDLATRWYRNDDLTAPLASGSFLTHGMVVVPCSMKTLAGMVQGFATNLLLRAADVTLKQRRKLVVSPRETPLSIIHLKNMVEITKAGAIVLPLTPAFYHKPQTIDDLVNYTVGKILDVFDVEHNLYKRWTYPNQMDDFLLKNE